LFLIVFSLAGFNNHDNCNCDAVLFNAFLTKGLPALYKAQAQGITEPMIAQTHSSSIVGNLFSATILYRAISQAHSTHQATIFCHVGAFLR
jgi:hypothetical protein